MTLSWLKQPLSLPPFLQIGAGYSVIRGLSRPGFIEPGFIGPEFKGAGFIAAGFIGAG